ncbi:multidrug resistance-associated protein/mitoxantrone resistance protein, ABC superfamily [Scheffersomyces xylosifermentans]|uniref:multidrug resistance-associated protein/mitoxantrone resistance protein, ABC superfamily n=1 Tax=Scheffersomyces xylosifermentans TaxID=1304137 RepID=UPI00315CF0E1
METLSLWLAQKSQPLSALHHYNSLFTPYSNESTADFHIFKKNPDWTSPLYSRHGNSLNPAFVQQISLYIGYFFAAFLALQLIETIAATSKKLTKSYLSKSLSYKVILTTVQVVLFLVLYAQSSAFNLLVHVGTLVLLVLPLQVLAPRKWGASLSSILLFWLANIAISFVVSVQDYFSKHKIYSINAWGSVLEVLILVGNVSQFVLETAYYEPLFEQDTDKPVEINILSYLTYFWVQPLIFKAYRTDELSKEDIPRRSDELFCDATYSKLNSEWERQKDISAKLSKSWPKFIRKPSLLISIFRSFVYYLFTTFLLDVTETVLNFTQPFVLLNLILFFQESNYGEQKPPAIIGYSLAFLMYAVACTRFFTFNQAFEFQYRTLFSVQTSLTSIIYTKALNLSPEARKNKSTGDIINHITVDIDSIKYFFMGLQDFITAPMKVVICLVSLHSILGNATWAGLLSIVFIMPFTGILISYFTTFYTDLLKFKDERTTLTNDILTSIKNIKLYSWETPMLKKLIHIRDDKELNVIRKLGTLNAGMMFIWNCIPFFISCSVYGFFAFHYNIPLTPEIVFPSLALFDLLSEPLFSLPNLISSSVQAKVSLGRISDFLLLDELDVEKSGVYEHEIDSQSENSKAIDLKNVTLLWSTKEVSEYRDEETEIEDSKSNIALNDITFSAESGKLTCVVGKVGSGKSTLIRSILGEIPISIPAYSDVDENKRPSVKIYGSIAYCPQSPWILNATVKENILFGYKYNAEIYNKTIEACELTTDFLTLPDGDKTVVGEKGISLSGGQKARISLARAVYSGADIYLLDDILSAVDAHVGKRIIKNVLGKDGILASKTKVLATNSVAVLHEASSIYLLKGSTISESGDFETVMARESDLAELIKEFGKKNEEDEGNETKAGTPVSELDEAEATESENDIVDFAPEDALRKAETTLRRASVVSYSHDYAEDEADSTSIRKTGNTVEEFSKGRVKWSVFSTYLKACNYSFIIFYLVLSTASILTSVGEKLVLTYWSAKNVESGTTNDPVFFLSLYSFFGVLGGLFLLVGSFIVWSYCIVKASSYFHTRLATSVLASPMSFFETTPVGRILNRFTEDIALLDMQLPWTFIGLAQWLVQGAITFIVITYNLPAMFIVLTVLFFIYNYVRMLFIPATRDLKRIESVSKSPVLATIQESINGVDTIKAYNQRDRFTYRSRSTVDASISASSTIQSINRWLSMRLQFISSSILFFSSILAVSTLSTKNPLNPALFGFIISYAMNITYILNAIVRYWAEAESQVVAVERILEYINLKPEAAMVIEDKRPSEDWPSNGKISFKGYSARYRENLDLVLKNIDISINAKEKVGVVGRTGAGKSSLTLALFRIIESAQGYIEIDGINTSEIGLYDLRHHLTIIPQDSSTFKGSVRENLDPFTEFSDDDLWRVLKLAHLKEHIEQMVTEPTEQEKKESKKPDELPTKRGLDARIEESGSNLSAGQKQLLSLARALLNDKSKILVLDEATAAVDVQTDKIIQETIRTEFKDKTIITIAHRLNTIMDSDRVLVLDKGEVREFDSPEKLKENTDGIFYSLCKEGGYL